MSNCPFFPFFVSLLVQLHLQRPLQPNIPIISDWLFQPLGNVWQKESYWFLNRDVIRVRYLVVGIELVKFRNLGWERERERERESNSNLGLEYNSLEWLVVLDGLETTPSIKITWSNGMSRLALCPTTLLATGGHDVGKATFFALFVFTMIILLYYCL